MAIDEDSGVPTITDPPAAEGRPRCCTHPTVGLPHTVTPKVRRQLYWGSRKWIKSFARRTHVEGNFGNLKNRNCENLSRGWLQTGGLVRFTLGMTFMIGAYNLRIGRKWNERTSLSGDPVFGAAPPFYGWVEITDDPESPADGEDDLPQAA